jgi:hypothetical protein
MPFVALATAQEGAQPWPCIPRFEPFSMHAFRMILALTVAVSGQPNCVPPKMTRNI